MPFNDGRPVIVDFHAVWCSSCKAQAPVLKQVADELGERIHIIKMDVFFELSRESIYKTH